MELTPEEHALQLISIYLGSTHASVIVELEPRSPWKRRNGPKSVNNWCDMVTRKIDLESKLQANSRLSSSVRLSSMDSTTLLAVRKSFGTSLSCLASTSLRYNAKVAKVADWRKICEAPRRSSVLNCGGFKNRLRFWLVSAQWSYCACGFARNIHTALGGAGASSSTFGQVGPCFHEGPNFGAVIVQLKGRGNRGWRKLGNQSLGVEYPMTLQCFRML